MAPKMTSGTGTASDRRGGSRPSRCAVVAHGTRLFLLLASASIVACTIAPANTKSRRAVPVDPGDDYFDDDFGPGDPPPLVPATNDDGGAFGAESRPAAKEPDAGPTTADAGPTTIDAGAPKVDAGAPIEPLCGAAPGPGDLVITELMIASRSGSNDPGEWVEITSTRDCRLALEGVTISSPRGTTTENAITLGALELPPRGSFLVAGSADPAKNNDLPGLVFAWNATDVLKNDGDTVTVRRDAVVIDEATYPKFSNLQPGRSIALPSDCVWSDRASWVRWSLTFDEWSPGLKGTPNAANDDVACY